MTTPHDPEKILGELGALGVLEGDVVMVHVSLRALGPIRGGAEALVGVFDRAVGPSGTVVVSVRALDEWKWVNDEPEELREGRLAGSPAFDALTTPADPEVGAFAEVFRTTPGTVVSDHPEGRIAARGRLAVELTSEVPWNDHYGVGSPLDRLVKAGGWILRLGSDRDVATVIHLAENLAPIPDKRRVRRHRLVAAPGGGPPVVRTIDCVDDVAGIADFEGLDAYDGDEFVAILDRYEAAGRPVTGKVGDADSQLIDAADLVNFSVDWMVAHAVVPARS